MPGAGKLDRLIDQAAVQAAFQAVGAAEACIHMARDYAMDRQIYGRPLGGFQAIKHKPADSAVATELSRSSSYYRGRAAYSSPAQLPRAAAPDRPYGINSSHMLARELIQVIGGS